MKIINSFVLGCAAVSVLVACNPQLVSMGHKKDTDAKTAEIWPKITSDVAIDDKVEQKVAELLASMTLEQKVAQMIQPEIRDITVEDMRRYGFGSYLNGGGAFPNNNKHSTPADWIKLAEDMYQASIDDSLDGISIPTMWGTDAVHGHNNVIGATLFPHNIGLGATNNPDLIEKIAQVTATEVMVTGIDWVFAPTVATVQDDRWGRTYESYSEDPKVVKNYAAAIVKGLQGHADKNFLGNSRVISTVKHFIGDGGTVGGDDQGNNVDTEQELFDIHAQGYVGGLTAGAQSVMASFNSWHGSKVHGNKYLLTDVLKDRMGFDGFVVGDWNGHGQIKGCTNENCPQAINAGLDIYMVPTAAWKPLLENTIKQVNSGIISMARIDDAVTRILRVKVRAGLFEKPSPANRQLSGKTELIGQQSHRDVARQAVRESLVLLKNNEQLLPLKPQAKVLVAGDAADNIGKQSGGWTITWQGTNNTNADFPGGSSIFDGIKAQVESANGSVELAVKGDYSTKPDVAIVVFGEEPYAEGHGDRKHVAYQQGSKSDLALLKKLKAQGIPVVAVFISGRPMWVNAELNAADAFVAAWLPGSEGNGVADVLFTDSKGKVQYDFVGKLPFSWPNRADQQVNIQDSDYQPLFAYGYGLTYQDKVSIPSDLNEVFSLDGQETAPRVLFAGAMKKPWVLTLSSGEQISRVSSNSLSLAGVSYRTIDRKVQEDAMQLAFTGEAQAAVTIVSEGHFREDLSLDLQFNPILNFWVKVEQAPTESVMLSMHCESEGDKPGSCRAALDIAEQLNAAPQGQWHSLSVPLSCFTNKGIKFENMVNPFTLSTSGKLTLGISEVTFMPEMPEQHLMSCQ